MTIAPVIPSRRPTSRFFRTLAAFALATAGLLAGAAPEAGVPFPLPRELPPQLWREQRALTSGWEFVRGDLGGIWETLRDRDRALELPVWTAVDLPHCVNARDAVDPDTPYYQGPSWYRTTLEIANPHAGGRTLLHFEGAGQTAEVWIGDLRVASHVGGYDEFTVDITAAVAAYRESALARLPLAEVNIPAGRVPLAVRCDNSRDLERMPSALSDFTLYGGLHRPVHLIYVPAAGLLDVHARPERGADGAWTLGLRARFAAEAEQELTVRVVDPDGREVHRETRTVRGHAEIAAIASIPLRGPRLWSPDSPQLYGVEVLARGPGGESRAWQRFGLRTFEFVEHGPFTLNGRRLLLRGTHRHEDHAGVGSAMAVAPLETEMRLMKAMGVNFIRLGHYQQSRRVLELCDELGLLVWEEIPWCRGGLGGEAYREQARRMLRAMITQHASHPSVILWGLGNENDWPGDFPVFDREAIRAFMRELHDLAHALDPTRLTAIRRCDFCRDIVDVYSPSIWAGWYRGQFSEYRDVSAREMKRVPRFLHVEWGGDSHAGRHAEDPYAPLRAVSKAGAADERGLDFRSVGGEARASKDGDWSETYICDLVDWHLKEQEEMPWLTGTAMWPFKDFATPLRPENPVPFVNQKGAVERDLTPKESYYVYQSYWTTQPMLRIYGHSWPVRWGRPGEKRWVKVYSNCEDVELWLNGVSQGKRRRDPRDFPAAGLRWEIPFEEGMNTLRAIGTKSGQEVQDEVLFRYETRAWGAPHHLRMQQHAVREGVARVQVELLDAHGVVCLGSAALVTFGHAGDGRLLDNLGTAGGSRKVQLANGRARIEVDVPATGQTVVSAAVAGVPTALITLRPTAAPGAGGPATRESLGHELVRLERERVVRLAEAALARPPVSFRATALPAHAVAAGAKPGDYYSMGDYWWPNPATATGLPYVRRDGETNPDNFDAHRLALREMRDAVAALGAAYLATRDPKYATAAAEWLRVFFVDAATRMNPHLQFAQAIPGVSTGRGIGIIDTLHLAEVALTVDALRHAPGVSADTLAATRDWFAEYLRWLRTSAHGRDEAATKNNHSVAYWLQVAVFARTVGDVAALDEARRVYREILLPGQLAPDGSFPRELSRTKPYAYSIFNLDNVVLLTEVLSSPHEDLWCATLADGRSVAQAVEFLFPYLADRSAWPFRADVAHFDAWPVRQPALLLAGARLNRPEFLALWRRLEPDPANLEVRRNLAVTQPLLWVLARGE